MLTAPSQFLIGKPRRFDLLYQAPPFDAYINANQAAARVLIKPSNGFPFAARYLRLSFAANVSGIPQGFANTGMYLAKWDTSPYGENNLPPTSTQGPNALFTAGSTTPGDNPVVLKFGGSPTFALAAGQVARCDMFEFHLAQGDGLVLQFSGLAAAVFSAPGVRTFIVPSSYLHTIEPGGSGAVVNATFASVACAGLLSIEGMQ